MDRYSDRLDPATYAAEEPVGIGLASQRVQEWLFVPLTVMHRLLAIGRAYELHLLGQALRDYEETRLNSLQCADLLDEIAFVASVVSDPVLEVWLPQLKARVLACVRSRLADEMLVLDLAP